MGIEFFVVMILATVLLMELAFHPLFVYDEKSRV